VKLQEIDQAGQYLLTAEDAKLLQEVLHHKSHLESTGGLDAERRRFRFQDLEFTRQLSTFDRQNPSLYSNKFHGFFTLFWLGVTLLLVKIAANNWRVYGSLWGQNEIIHLMFRKDVLVLGISDLFLCWSTVFCLGLQRAVLRGYLRWSGLGWLIQNVRQEIIGLQRSHKEVG
jgi:sterol O-acyltransferase